MNSREQSPLTAIQTRWVSEVLGASVPGEPLATCDACVMCTNVAPGASSFDAAVKCCTFTPTLANFLVGQALADADPAGAPGRASIRKRIDAGVGVTPLGLAPAPVALLLHEHGERGFGKSLALLCPHYVEPGGLCGIWSHRNGVCATWFCKHVRGIRGTAFWQRVRDLLTAIERDLARSVLLDLDLGPGALAKIFETRSDDDDTLSAAALDGRVAASDREALFGRWAGREEDLYRASAEIVANLDLDAVLARAGADARIRVELVRDAWRKLGEGQLPEKLRVGRLTVVHADAAKCRVATYSNFDPVQMPRELYAALPSFDGRSTSDALREIESNGGPRISEKLVRKLVDFGVLTADEEP